MKIPRLIYSLMIILPLISCGEGKLKPAEDNSNKAGLILTGGTVMRIHPVLYSSKVDELKNGETVEIIAVSAEKAWIGKTNDYWYKVRKSGGITGWVFGQNIKIVSAKNTREIEGFAREMHEKEIAAIKKDITGKWWSINNFNDFTNHCLELYDSGKYHSYFKGSEKGIEGEYEFDFNKNEIIFKKGATFKTNLNFIKRGQTYSLFKETDDGGVKLRKIMNDVDEKKAKEGQAAEPQSDDIKQQEGQ